MKKILSLLAICVSSLLSQPVQLDTQSDKDYLLTKFANAGLKPIETRSDTLTTPRCQTLIEPIFKLGYRTRIVDFDAKTGITLCDIYGPHNTKTGLTANTISPTIATQANPPLSYNDIASLIANDLEEDLKITYNASPPEGFLPLSRFIAAIMTLDPDIVDFALTNSTSRLKLKGNYSPLQLDIPTGGTATVGESVASKFNDANLAYYSNLFSNMSEIYGYVQNLLFVFIGMFFIGKVGFDKGLRALDKSKESSGDTQWLSKFYIPVLTVGFFFAPIPENAGMSATIVQKMIRFMVTESTAIADRASAVGVNTYMQKLYSSVGAMSAKNEEAVRLTVSSSSAQVPIYNATISTLGSVEGVCTKRFPYAKTGFLGIFPKSIEEEQQESIDPRQIVSNDDYSKQAELQDISFEACRTLEYRMRVQQSTFATNSDQLESIKRAYNSDELKNILKTVNEQLQDQQNKLGWTNAIIIPSVAILIESLPDIQSASNTNVNDLSVISKVIGNDKLAAISEQMNAQRKGREAYNNKSAINMGVVVGKLAYMTLPGAKSVYEALKENQEEAEFIASSLNVHNIEDYVYGNGSTASGSTVTAGSVYTARGETMDEDGKADGRTYLKATSAIYAWFIQKLPITVSVIAGVVAFIGYVIELAKYYYISPFVVAFALTTKKTHKIVEFGVTGLMIFFKPLLLVIFIFFSIYIYTLVQDIFMHYVANQFGILGRVAGEKSSVYLVLNLVQTMMEVLGSLAATYIMWKLILTGPTWSMKLVGVDNAQNDMISEALSQRMDRAGFRM